MRDIKFRGKNIQGEWVYGAYHTCQGAANLWKSEKKTNVVEINRHWILVPHLPQDVGWTINDTFSAYSVIPETVGQFTGHQIGGIDLYDGDIVREEMAGEEGDERLYLVVAWIREWGMFGGINIEGEYEDYLSGGTEQLDESSFWTFPITAESEFATISICGNIHDNPELLHDNKTHS